MRDKKRSRIAGCPRCGAAYERKSGFMVCRGCGHKPGDQHPEHPAMTGATSSEPYSGRVMYGRVLPHRTYNS
jgi:hypothetical protein